MWVLPPDVGPKYILSIKDTWSLRRVGIGADVPSGSRILKCDGAISPDGSVIGAIDSGKDFTVFNFARPRLYQ